MSEERYTPWLHQFLVDVYWPAPGENDARVVRRLFRWTWVKFLFTGHW